jgi:uncharacterized protein with von Willebrand factor type A (vWA) domain
MITDNDLAQKLKEYDEAFDFYMDVGRLPDQIPPDDVLGGFIGQIIDENPQLSCQDPLWTELLKEELMKFLEAMILLFQPIEESHDKEKNIIKTFVTGEIETKRSLWGQVSSVITSQYKAEEVNLDGYVEQLKGNDPEPVWGALAKDWDKACDERENQQKIRLLESQRKKWEQHVREHGLTDYKERQKKDKFFYSYPQLRDLVRIIGREQPKRDDEMDDTVMHYLPLLPSPPKPAAEAEEITNGKDVQHLLPSETAIMSDKQTESLFFLKYASQQLQVFANRPKEVSRHKTEQVHKKEPRLGKGPIIVAVDTSGSMSGTPLKIAYSVLEQLLRLSRKQKRKCFLLSFSVRAKSLDLSLPHNWMHLDQFLEDYYSGGTDGEEMLNKALCKLQTNSFAMADVLIISDFEFPLPRDETRRKMLIEHNKGTRFYGLGIGREASSYDKILDKTWNIK